MVEYERKYRSKIFICLHSAGLRCFIMCSFCIKFHFITAILLLSYVPIYEGLWVYIKLLLLTINYYAAGCESFRSLVFDIARKETGKNHLS